MVEALNKGDEVVTAGGIVGKITEIADQYVTVQVATVNGQPVQLSMQRAAVQTIAAQGHGQVDLMSGASAAATSVTRVTPPRPALPSGRAPGRPKAGPLT